jgi:signal peptidase II
MKKSFLKLKKYKSYAGYAALFFWAFVIDRVTKYWVLNYLTSNSQITSFLSFEFVMNRGISWGFFHSDAHAPFVLLSLMIFGVVMLLASFAYRRLREEDLIIGEVLVIAGALSNIVDRVIYQGVIDFIVFSWGSLSFPAFNIADACIVIGVGIMFISVYKKS